MVRHVGQPLHARLPAPLGAAATSRGRSAPQHHRVLPSPIEAAPAPARRWEGAAPPERLGPRRPRARRIRSLGHQIWQHWPPPSPSWSASSDLERTRWKRERGTNAPHHHLPCSATDIRSSAPVAARGGGDGETWWRWQWQVPVEPSLGRRECSTGKAKGDGLPSPLLELDFIRDRIVIRSLA